MVAHSPNELFEAFPDEFYVIDNFYRIFREYSISTCNLRSFDFVKKYLIGGFFVQFKDEWFVDQRMVSEFFENRKVIVFGAGQDGKKFANTYGEQVDIECFLDNSIAVGSSGLVNDIYISYNPQDIKKIPDGKVILICSERYYIEMFAQLFEAGYEPGVDFYILADFVTDENIERFIEHNKKVWKNHAISDTDNEVLVLYTEYHSGANILRSYYANVLAQKNYAKIIGFPPITAKPMPIKTRLYRSFNVVDVILYDFTEEQEQEISFIYNQICTSIQNKQDVLNITINGYRFGLYIYSVFLRFVSPVFDLPKYKIDIFEIVLSCIKNVVYWENYFKYHTVKAIILEDAIYTQSYMREIAISHGIPVYSVRISQCARCYSGYFTCSRYGINYKNAFMELSQEEKEYGISWAKHKLDMRVHGDNSDIPYMGNRGTYKNRQADKLLLCSEKIKVVICPHCFTDDPFPYGEFLFHDQYEWLEYLGKLSQETDYDWYFKIHPAAEELSLGIYEQILRRYQNIHLLPIEASAVQMRDEGMEFALTLWGTIGHEYAYLGINVINGGYGPHSDFSFNYNPKSLDEYKELILNLPSLNRNINKEEIYQFYCMHYLYRCPLYMNKDDIIHPDIGLFSGQYAGEYKWIYNKNGMPTAISPLEGTYEYTAFLNKWNTDRHDSLLQAVNNYINVADNLVECMNKQGNKWG